MGRSGKVEMRRIEDGARRQVTFGKRRAGLLKKACELAVLCDAHLGVLVFSRTGKLFDYCSPNTSWSELIQRYESTINAQLQETNDDDDDQQMLAEILRLRRERDQLEASLRRHTGEDLSSVATKEELDSLQQQLEWALGKVLERKDELLNQQLDESHHKINEDGQHRSVAEALAVATEGMATRMLPETAFGGFYPEAEEEESPWLQPWTQQLPGVQGFGLPDHGLRQW